MHLYITCQGKMNVYPKAVCNNKCPLFTNYAVSKMLNSLPELHVTVASFSIIKLHFYNIIIQRKYLNLSDLLSRRWPMSPRWCRLVKVFVGLQPKWVHSRLPGNEKVGWWRQLSWRLLCVNKNIYLSRGNTKITSNYF